MIGAGDETRTRDPQLGRLMLYQLSYARKKDVQRFLAGGNSHRLQNPFYRS